MTEENVSFHQTIFKDVSVWVYNRFRVLEVTLNISTFTILEILPKRESNETASYRVSLFTLSPRVDLVPLHCNLKIDCEHILFLLYSEIESEVCVIAS